MPVESHNYVSALDWRANETPVTFVVPEKAKHKLNRKKSKHTATSDVHLVADFVMATGQSSDEVRAAAARLLAETDDASENDVFRAQTLVDDEERIEDENKRRWEEHAERLKAAEAGPNR